MKFALVIEDLGYVVGLAWKTKRRAGCFSARLPFPITLSSWKYLLK